MLKKGFLGPSITSNKKLSKVEKGERVVESGSSLASFFDVAKVAWEEMANHLDPLNVELLKSSLGESSCLDSDDFKHHFHQVVDELNDDELGFDMLNNFLSAHKAMEVTSEEQSGMEFASSSFTEHLVELKKDINLMPQNMESSSPIASSVGALNFSNTEEHSSTIEASLSSDISSSIPSTNSFGWDYLLVHRDTSSRIAKGHRFQFFHKSGFAMVTLKIQDPVAILPHSEKQPVLSSLDILDYKSKVHATVDEVMDEASNKLDNLQTISMDFGIHILPPNQVPNIDTFQIENHMNVPNNFLNFFKTPNKIAKATRKKTSISDVDFKRHPIKAMGQIKVISSLLQRFSVHCYKGLWIERGE